MGYTSKVISALSGIMPLVSVETLKFLICYLLEVWNQKKKKKEIITKNLEFSTKDVGIYL